MITVRGAAAVAALALGLSAWTPYGAAASSSAEPVDLGGQPIDGSTDPGHPTQIEAGLWAVRVGLESEPMHFVYQRQIEGSTIHIGAIAAPTGIDGDGLQLSATDAAADDPEGDDCGGDYESSDSTVPFAVVGIQVVVGDEDDDVCRAADTIAITLGRYSSYNDGELPAAIKIVEEAPVADPGEPLDDSEELRFRMPDPADPAPTPEGASSFDTAPVVDLSGGPTTVETTVSEGTDVLWRVPLDWGDQLVARVDLPALDEDDAERLGSPSTYVTVSVVQPSREVFTLYGDETYYGYYGGTEASTFVAATYPLRYANRLASDVVPTLPGDHWVSVSAAPAPDDRASIDVPIKLTLAVAHTDAAPPSYKNAVLAQDGGAGPEGYSAQTPYLVGADRFAAVASGNPLPSTTDDEETSWWGARRYAGIGVGVVSLACCAVGAVWLTRRRAR